jgi:O-antigen/teichoic acid export membrane protein
LGDWRRLRGLRLALQDQMRQSRPMAVSTLATIGLGYAAFALSARLLASTDFGLLGALLGVLSVISVALRPLHTTATHFAVEVVARQRPADIAYASAHATVATGGAALILVAALGLLQPVVGSALHLDTFAPLAVLACLVCATALWQICSAHLLALRRLRAFALATTADSLTRTVFMAPLTLVWGVAGALAAYLIGVLVATVMAIHFSGGLAWGRRPQLTMSNVASVGGASLVLTLIIGLLQNSDLVALRSYAPADLVGDYAGATALGNFLFAVQAPLYLPLYSQIRSAHLHGRGTAHLVLATAIPILSLGALAVAFSVPLGVPVAALLLGPALSGAGTYLPLYFAKITALLTLFILGQYTLATERTWPILVAFVPAAASIGLLVQLRPEPMFAPAFALIGASIGIVVLAFGSALNAHFIDALARPRPR